MAWTLVSSPAWLSNCLSCYQNRTSLNIGPISVVPLIQRPSNLLPFHVMVSIGGKEPWIVGPISRVTILPSNLIPASGMSPPVVRLMTAPLSAFCPPRKTRSTRWWGMLISSSEPWSKCHLPAIEPDGLGACAIKAVTNTTAARKNFMRAIVFSVISTPQWAGYRRHARGWRGRSK